MTASVLQWQFDTLRDDADDFHNASAERVDRNRARADAARGAIPSDVDVLAELILGNEWALATIFDRYLEPLVRFADLTLGMSSGPAGAAGDIVSDVFVALWTRCDALGSVQNLRAYLYRAVRNRALDVRRSERREDRRFNALAGAGEMVGMGTAPERPDEHVEHDERLRLIWRTVHSLREPLRTIAVLRWSHGMPFAEIAAVVESSEGSVRVHASRALAALRKTIPELLR